MDRRTFLQRAGWAGLATAGGLAVAQGQRPAQRPNIVFFLVDDLGWADVGCYGSSFYETPNIDRLAASGMRFTDAYAACPVCSPTRASIMTGKHPVRVGITDWIPGADPGNRPLLGPRDLHQMPLTEVTIAEALKTDGYGTFFAGKWHLGSDGFLPQDQGFDINKGGHRRGSPPGGYYAPYKNPQLESGPAGEYLTDRLAAESIAFMTDHVRDHPRQPFFVCLSFYTVHTPIQACKRHLERFRAKAQEVYGDDTIPPIAERKGRTRARQDNIDYATMVYAMDENVGRLLSALDKLGVEDNTVVIFMSDNGGLSTKRRPGPTCNLPLRAGKGWCYEGGIREPMIIRAPGVARPGQTCSVPVTSMDFYPTILELAGLPLRPEQHADGLSLVPLLRGESALPRQALHWHFPHYHGSTWTPGGAIRAGDWKLVEFFEDRTAELYNLRTDPGERTDLSEHEPDRKAHLLRRLQDWRLRMGAKMPTPNPRHTP